MWKLKVPTDGDREAIKQRLDEDLGDSAIPLVQAYFDGDRGFAGTTFDLLDGGGEATPRITVGDLLAVSLLNTPYPARAVRDLLGGTGEQLAVSLAAIPAGLPLADADEAILQQADEAWSQLMALNNVGRTRVSKLLARKRPHLIPITDSIVDERLSPQQSPLSVDLWSALRDQLQDGLSDDLASIRRDAGVPEQISLLRVLDVAIWMRHGNSSRAELVRKELNLAAC
ncbi:MAG: DUF6308 family protein [Actinomycetota bacterium]